MNHRIKIAIDPGQSGAMAVRWPDGSTVAYDFETEADMVSELRSIRENSEMTDTPVNALLERVASRPAQGVASVFKFGSNYGFWRGALQGIGISFYELTPQQWQNKVGGVPTTVQGADRKRKLKQIAAERYPNHRVTLKNADALLMVEVME